MRADGGWIHLVQSTSSQSSDVRDAMAHEKIATDVDGKDLAVIDSLR